MKVHGKASIILWVSKKVSSVYFDNEFINVWFHCRPTATELLKHPFFKKAKDRKYLQQTLVAIGPSLETRVQKVCICEYN
jgi:hypothetical protein